MEGSMRPYSCFACHASYSRASHLRRHEATHMVKPCFPCPFCSASFSRSDTTRRHARTCPERRGQPDPPPLKRGRKFQACDSCALAKSACDCNQPCSNCATRGYSCTYGRVVCQKFKASRKPRLKIPSQDAVSSTIGWPTPRSNTPPAVEERTADSTQSLTAQEPDSKRIPISFLLQYTDPHNNTLQDYFNQCFPEEDSKELAATSETTDDVPTISEDSLEVGAGLESYILKIMGGDGFVDPFDAFEYPSPIDWETMFQQENDDSSNLGSDAKLETRLMEISSELLSCLRSVPAAETPRSLSDSVRSIFVAEKVPSFIQSYFDNWHHHCPMLHRPSFSPSTAFSPLLAAVILIGAIYLSRDSAAAARDCLSTAEDYVFEHDAFKRLVYPQSEQHTAEYIFPLQAAFLMAILQHWDNHEDSRRRIRLQRYSNLVSAARHLGLTSLRHSPDRQVGMPSSGQDWEIFVKTEEKIRLMTWIFLVDSSHAIFHRTPPRLTLTEMTGSLPCTESLFIMQHPDSQYNQEWLQSFSRVPSLATGMTLLMGEEWTDAFAPEMEHLSCLDLFVLISGLHEIIFSTYTSCSLSLARGAIRQALARWKLLWDRHMEKLTKMEIDRLGFFKNASEYWWLANLFLEEGMPETKGENKEVSDRDSMEEVNSFVKRFLDLSI